MKIDFQIKAILLLIFTTFIFLALHVVLLNNVLPAEYKEGPWWISHAVLPPITLAGIIFIIRRFKKNNGSITRSFIVYTAIKLFGVILMLMPWLIVKDDYTILMVYQFFALFFPFLFIEIFLLVSLLAQSDPKKVENDEIH